MFMCNSQLRENSDYALAELYFFYLLFYVLRNF